MKDITAIENIQKWATKFILSEYSTDYKIHLTRVHILPLMHDATRTKWHFVICSLSKRTYKVIQHSQLCNFPHLVPPDHPPISNSNITSLEQTPLDTPSSNDFHTFGTLFQQLFTIKHKLSQFFWNHKFCTVKNENGGYLCTPDEV